MFGFIFESPQENPLSNVANHPLAICKIRGVYQNWELTQQDNNRWCASYVTVAMLDDIDKGFCLFAMQISSNMAKIALSFESHGSGCTSPIWDIYPVKLVLLFGGHQWTSINTAG
jgi:hypothetical protein